MQGALSLCHRRRCRLPETLYRHGQFQGLKLLETFQVLSRHRQALLQKPLSILAAFFIHFLACLADNTVNLFQKFPARLSRALGSLLSPAPPACPFCDGSLACSSGRRGRLTTACPLACSSDRRGRLAPACSLDRACVLGIVAMHVFRVIPGGGSSSARAAALGQVQIPDLRLHVIVDHVAAGPFPHGLQAGTHGPGLGHRVKVFFGEGHILGAETVRHRPSQGLAAQSGGKSLYVQIVGVTHNVLPGLGQFRLDPVHYGHNLFRIHAAGVKPLFLHLGIVLFGHGM